MNDFKPLTPSKYLKKVIAQADKDYMRGDKTNYSPTFDNADDAITWIEKKRETI